MIEHFIASGLQYVRQRTAGFDPAEQRDMLAHLFLQTDCSHMLSIDSDMVFDADLYSDLLKTGKDFIGAAYTKRKFDLAKALDLAAKGIHPTKAIAASYQFSVGGLDSGHVERHGNLYKVGHTGMGFTLIARSWFERLSTTVPTYLSASGDPNYPQLKAFFGRIPGARGALLNEDASFCRRVIQAGGEIWAYPSTKIGHIGTMIHKASFHDHIMAMKELASATSPASPAAPARPRAAR